MERMGQWFRVALAVFAMFIGMMSKAEAQSTELGRFIENVAVLSFEADGKIVTVETAPAVFQVQARKTESSISFWRQAAAAPDRQIVTVTETFYSPTGSHAGPFEKMSAEFPFPVKKPAVSGSALLSAELPVIQTSRLYAGETTLIKVVDAGQNGDPRSIESVVIEVETDAGDMIVVKLAESGPDTGEFFGYVMTEKNSEAITTYDPKLSVAPETRVTAIYEDRFDRDEISQSIALVDPNGRIFNSTTGEYLNNILVRVVDKYTGQLAPVYGNDGKSRYPSELVTGQVITDEGGEVYDLRDGEFLFPLMPPGEYRIELDPPPGFIFPSLARNFDGLANSPFDISEGSFHGDFTLDGSGPIIFDIPLDPSSNVSVEKTTTVRQAAIGDFIPFSIKVTNLDESAARIIIRDDAPHGFRLTRDSVRLNGLIAPAGMTSMSGSRLQFDPGQLGSGQSLTIEYVMEVAAGTVNGKNVNRAVAIDGLNQEVSNLASAEVFIQEDLLRSTSTIIGQVMARSCDPNDKIPLNSSGNTGIAGVRLYLETGEYVVSDENGLFHFEQISAGTHVVRLDDGALPKGYRVSGCKTINGRTTAMSQFVDVRGGAIWSVYFSLEPTGELLLNEDEVVAFNDATEHKRFDQAWLDAQPVGIGWVYPDVTRTPSTKSVNLGIRHGADQRVELWLNSKRLQASNYAGLQMSTNGRTGLSKWRSIDIEDGQNRVEARILDGSGNEVTRLTRDIWFVKAVTQAEIIPERSALTADGTTSPVIAVRFADDGGRPVHSGRIVGVDIESPYQMKRSGSVTGDVGLSGTLADEGNVAVGPDGVGLIELEPTLETGTVTLRIKLDNGRVERLRTFLKPEPRPWIVIGLAEFQAGSGAPGADGAIGGDTKGPAGNKAAEALDPFTDGRLALYAKGRIGNDWLATIAVDTDKRRGDQDTGFNREIDPGAAYNLFGDSGYQQNDAPSRYPVFAKLEKGRFQAMLGDYNTDMQETELSRYSREMSGVRVIQETDRYSVTAFAAETNQGFNTDELPADGTSGPYQLSVAPILGQSEKVILQTRDRVRPDRILDERVMTRYMDYNLDYRSGELVFRLPVNATDQDFNPTVIVVDYETSEKSERHITAGGRASVRLFDDKLELGTTLIHEGGSQSEADVESALIGVDLRAEISDNTLVRLEYASSQTDAGDDSNPRKDALFAEIVHQTEDLSATGYFREEDTGFGLGQTRSDTEDIRRYGLTASYQLSHSDEADTGERVTRLLTGEASKEENLTTGDERESVAVGLKQSARSLTLDSGLRYVGETLKGNEHRVSILATGGIQKHFADQGLSLLLRHEQPLDDKQAVTSFPKRTVLGFDKTLTKTATLTGRHEILDGDNASGQNSVLGLVLHPWTGAEVRAETDLQSTESANRVSAVFGIDQSVQLSKSWSVSLGAARRGRVDGNEDVANPLDDDADGPLQTAPVSVLTGTDDFTSAYAGAAYKAEKSAISARIEARDSQLGSRYIAAVSAARQATETTSYAGSARFERENAMGAADHERAEIRLGLAHRPKKIGPVVFDRLDLKTESLGTSRESWKIVNNLAVNVPLSPVSQASVFVGTKYAKTTISGDGYSGWTHLAGGEFRHNITQKIDIGLTGSALWSENSGTMEYAYGPSVGYKPNEDIWISAGWNIDGFSDRDFEAAEYMREGPYVKFRLKFDEDTIKGLVSRVTR